MNREEYQEYLKSAHWRTISRLVKERDGYACVVCGEETGLQVHHRTYDGVPYGESLNDCYTLCDACHEYAGKRMEQAHSGSGSGSGAKPKSKPTPSPARKSVSLTNFRKTRRKSKS